MMMKMHRLYILLVLMANFACSSNKTKITGMVKEGGESTLVLERLDGNHTTVIDSLNVRNDGSFLCVFQPEEPELYILRNESGQIINLLLAPGEKVSLKTSANNFGKGYEVNGSVETENIRKLVEHLDRTRYLLDSIVIAADSIAEPDSPQMDLLRSAYAQTIVKQKRFTIRYLVEHMKSLSSVYALYQKYDEESLILDTEPDLQYFKTVADSLESTYPNSSLTKSLRADVINRETRYKQASHINNLMKMANEVSGMLDLSIPDREGEVINLSSLKGNVILVTFWASASEKSVQALLGLRSTYNRYHKKGFEVYAISLDNNKISWMNTIDFNEFDWINVSELSYPDSRANILYNVTSIPTNYLINREGDIVAKNLSGKTLETWLDNLI